MGQTGKKPSTAGGEPFRVYVLREAEEDRAWKDHFQRPGDVEEMRFKLALLESWGLPPTDRAATAAAQHMALECKKLMGEWVYAIRFSGIRQERVPPIVAMFYLDTPTRTAYVASVMTAREFERHTEAMWKRGAIRAMAHRIAKRSAPGKGGRK